MPTPQGEDDDRVDENDRNDRHWLKGELEKTFEGKRCVLVLVSARACALGVCI